MNIVFLSKRYETNTIIMILIIILSIIFFSVNNLYSYYSFDEAYSITIIQNNFKEIIYVTKNDVHPPLYYFMLKLFTLLFGNEVFVMRMFSLLGVVLTMVLALYPIRKIFGDNISISYLVLFLLTPATQYLTGEIRMYSWVMFFVTLSAIYAYLSYKYNKFKYWFVLSLSSIISAYLQNYGLVTVGLIYGVLIILIFITKKKNSFLPLSLSILTCCISYLPWLIILLKQINTIIDIPYWIQEPTFFDIIRYPYYIFETGGKSLLYTFFEFLMPILCLLIIISSSFVNRIEEKEILGILSLSIFILISFSGIILSFLIKPIFVPRYMVVGLGLFILGFSIILNNLNYTKIINKILISLFVVLLLYHTSYKFYRIHKDHKIREYNRERVIGFINRYMNDSTAFVYNMAPYTNEDLFRLSLSFTNKHHYRYSSEMNIRYPVDINSFEILGDKHKSLILSGELLGKYNIVSDKSTLRDLEKSYTIKDSVLSEENTVIYYLESIK